MMRVRGLAQADSAARGVLAEIDNYSAIFARHGGDLRAADILEIGYGQRPMRLLALHALGFRVQGIDIDRPTLRLSLASLIQTTRLNGLRRAIKSGVRHVLFDRSERQAMDRALRQRGARLKIDEAIFTVGDAAALERSPASLDFIYSEDVFEHIQVESLERIVASMARWLTPTGIAVITPCVFASLPGSHLVDYYPHRLADTAAPRASGPWGHVFGEAQLPDCYLNKLRLAEYRRLFETHFTICEEIDLDAGIGAAFLTPALEQRLSGYEHRELVGSRFRFVLRRKQQ